MKHQINTIREALEIERFACIHESIKVPEHLVDALTALAQIEADHYSAADMADAQAKAFRAGVASVQQGEPVAFVTDADVACFGKGAQGEIAALLHRQGKWCHPLFTGTPVAQQPQYEAGDMASAAAQGFRDGVASVAQQPQARPDFTDEWTGYLKDGETPFERFLRERKDLTALTKLYQRALEENERLKTQQPQAEAVPWAIDDLDGMAEAFRRVIDCHYNTRYPFHNPVYADAHMAHRILVGYLPYMKRAAIAQQKGQP